MDQNTVQCSCAHHKVGGVLIILFALTFLLGNLEMISKQIVDITWPILVGIGGVFKLMQGSCKCCVKS